MRALVTGGAGFIGSHIAERLVRKGWEIAVLDDLSSGSAGNMAAFLESIEFIEGSITDAKAVKKAVAGADYVFHEAALVSVVESISNPEKTHRINAEGTKNVLDASLNAGVKRVLFASSAAIYGDAEPPITEGFAMKPLSPYGESKVEGEKLMKEFNRKGLETVCLRYFNAYGPRQDPNSQYSGVITRFIGKMLNG
ncbi:SDR family NAD(P)-dependent oxidoreductase, partial [Candidatus Micrarchaeota archaeon]|nr:SDR family NAD(P)-dependent oxidoreductase [Candidatus Micrarchaeota archaeon]